MPDRSVENWEQERGKDRRVADGDVVVVHSRYDEVDQVVIERDGQFHNRYGVFDHNELKSGGELGRRWVSSSSKLATGAGFVLALRPTPELWTLSLPHRTQIVYSHDIAVMLMEMELRPGCIVVEAGTGSGSMTVSLARAVAPTGRVLSFEFDEKRTHCAVEEFKRLHIDDIVTVTHRDVVQQGFAGIPDNTVDAVFLDLPAVWDVVAEAERVLQSDGVLATFSPCVEQVHKTRDALRDRSFCEVKTATVGLRSWDSRPRLGDVAAVDTEPKRKRKRETEGRGNKAGERRGKPDKTRTIERPQVPVISRPFRETTSHTSYLTFARKTVAPLSGAVPSPTALPPRTSEANPDGEDTEASKHTAKEEDTVNQRTTDPQNSG